MVSARRQGILQLDLTERTRLYMAYMSFIKDGGLFVPTDGAYELGDEVFVLVTLPEEPEPKGVAGKVVWITPRGVPSPRTQGIGVQISPQDRGEMHRQIEALLAPVIGADRPTQTL